MSSEITLAEGNPVVASGHDVRDVMVDKSTDGAVRKEENEEDEEEETIETHAPFQVHLQHLQTDYGLLRLILHVNTVDAAWFAHTRRQKSIYAYLIRIALDRIAKEHTSVTIDLDQIEQQKAKQATKDGKKVPREATEEEEDADTAVFHRATAQEAFGLTLRWQIASYWQETMVPHCILTKPSGQSVYTSLEILPKELHAFVEPYDPDLPAVLARPPRFSHFVHYDVETSIKDYFTSRTAAPTITTAGSADVTKN